MSELTIVVPGELRGKGRPRFGNGRTYTDAKTQNAETWIRSCAISQVGQPVLDGALEVRLTIEVEVPASWSAKKRAAALAGSVRPTGRPDVDNQIKSIGDALNKIVWRDDSQIVDLQVSRRYSDIAKTIVIVRSAAPS